MLYNKVVGEREIVSSIITPAPEIIMSRSNAVRTEAAAETIAKVETNTNPVEATSEVLLQTQEPTAAPAVVVEDPKIAEIVGASTTKSAKIRSLLAMGLKRGDIAKKLGVRYQFVRIVDITPVKRAA